MHLSGIFVRAQQTVVIICVGHSRTYEDILGEIILKSANTKRALTKTTGRARISLWITVRVSEAG